MPNTGNFMFEIEWEPCARTMHFVRWYFATCVCTLNLSGVVLCLFCLFSSALPLMEYLRALIWVNCFSVTLHCPSNVKSGRPPYRKYCKSSNFRVPFVSWPRRLHENSGSRIFVIYLDLDSAWVAVLVYDVTSKRVGCQNTADKSSTYLHAKPQGHHVKYSATHLIACRLIA